ncbi:MAG: SufS family cysteine desulfurase [Pirellulales bacterium]
MELIPLEELTNEFQHLDELEACQYLEELGRALPEFPEQLRTDQLLVPGCQSRVWLITRLSASESPVLEIVADSDAMVVKGLVFVVMCMYCGRTPSDVLAVDYRNFFDRLGLGRLILPQRKNGLFSMVKRIRLFAESTLEDEFVAAGATAKSRDAVSAAEHVVPRAIETARADFPVFGQQLPTGGKVVYLDSASSAQKPVAVIEKEREVEETYYANAFRGRYYFGNRIDDEIEAAREKVRALIGAASADEIIFTSGTTMSINLVADCWGRKFLQPGDEVVINEMEHHANLVPWQRVAAERGAVLKFIPLTADGELDLSQLEQTITADCKLVAVSGMSNVLGTINPIDSIAARAAEVGALILVDAAQSVPHAAVDATSPPVDFLAFSGHKLYGPTGIGILYARREMLQAMDPFFGGGHMIERVGREHSTWAEPPAKFEAGTIPIVQAIALGAAVDYVQSIGFDAIHAHERQLLRSAHQRLESIPGLTIYGPPVERKGAIVSFTISGISAEDLAWRLDRAGVFTRHGHHCTMLLHDWLGTAATTRASFGLYNTMEDVVALEQALRAALHEIGTP